MPFYHVQIVYKKSGEKYESTEYELNLSAEDAKLLSEQYEKGMVFFKGKWIDVLNIKTIKIRETPIKSTSYLPNLSSYMMFNRNSTFIKIATRQFIKSPPTKKGISDKPEKLKQPLGKNIFIVHGRDKTPALELARVIEKRYPIDTILLEEKAHRGRTIIEKLEDYSEVDFAIIILTPDDLGALKGEPHRERGRQNVIFELGQFIGKIGRKKVCLLIKGDIEIPSDLRGVGYHRFHNSINECYLNVETELKEAGLI